MQNPRMPNPHGGSAKIIEDKYAHPGRQPRLSPLPIDLRTDLVDSAGFSRADFVERIPHFRLQTNARASVRKRDVTTDKSRHKPPREYL